MSRAVATLPDIPGYRLQHKLGEGGMGEVYLAEQIGLGRTVAVKFLRSPAHRQPGLRLPRESQLMASLTHPHVVTVLDSGQAQGRHYLVLEYVAGPSLRSLMKPMVAWPLARSRRVLAAIGRALGYIHEQGILHLDLKPENVLLTGRGQPKITDFGLAMPRVDARTLSELGLAQGTIDYCPPEQRYGLPCDARADLFALATLTYELLTGRLPGRVYTPASWYNPALPAAVNDALARALRRDPEERHASVVEFCQQLLPALGPRRRRAPWRSAGGAGFLVALACLGGGDLGTYPQRLAAGATVVPCLSEECGRPS